MMARKYCLAGLIVLYVPLPPLKGQQSQAHKRGMSEVLRQPLKLVRRRNHAGIGRLILPVRTQEMTIAPHRVTIASIARYKLRGDSAASIFFHAL